MSIAVSLDGVLAPIDGANNATDVRAKEAAAERWVSKRPAGYRKASCATVSFCDERGDLLGAIRMARAAETKKATLKTMLTAETHAILARRPDLKLVKVADAVLDRERGPGIRASCTGSRALVRAQPARQRHGVDRRALARQCPDHLRSQR